MPGPAGAAVHRIGRIDFDPDSLTAGSPEQEEERRIAVKDLLADNYFEPEGAPGGPYELKLGCADNRLEISVSGPDFEKRHLLSLQPFRRIIRDYFMVCDSYREAVRGASSQQIEALDMGRRGLHNEGSELLRERLAGKAKTDHETARRLFTLLCALHWRGLI
ncbi:MAG TPA: UPF0262 family protein [Caulobacteraceae bacterium]